MTTATHSNHRTNDRAVLTIFRRDFGGSWRGLLTWAAGLVAMCFLYLPLYPSLSGTDMKKLLNGLPPELIDTLGYSDITTGAGYLQAAVFGLLGFVLLTIAGVSWGAAALAGAEESGNLELTLAHGVSRIQCALQSAAAIVVKLLCLGAITYMTVLALNQPSKLGLTALNLLAETLAWVGLAALTAAVALACGAVTGRRRWAIGGGAGIAVLGYVFQAVANNNPNLGWLRNLSPYAWAFASSPLKNGFDWAGLGLLWGGTALFIVVATVALNRRDVTG